MLTLEETYGSAAPLSDEDVLAILKHKVRGVDTEDGQRTLFQLFSHGLLCVPREVRDEPLREESGAVPKARRDDAGAVPVRREEELEPAASAVRTHDETTAEAGIMASVVRTHAEAYPRSGARAAVARAKDEVPSQEENKKSGYWIDSHEMEAMRDEAERLEQELATFRASAESVNNSVFHQPGCEKWIAAAQKELDNMSEVWVEVRKGHVREDLNLDENAKVAKPLPMKLVNTLKPSSDPEKPVEPKVRLVACGNYENSAGGSGSPEEFSTQNVDPYVIKAMASELAHNKDWVIAAGDVSAAFLNSPLGGSEWILLEPPAVLKRLGLVKPDVLYAPYKAIYG